MVFKKNDLVTGRIKELESTKIEIISLELTVSKHKWINFSVYRPSKGLFIIYWEYGTGVSGYGTRTFFYASEYGTQRFFVFLWYGT